MRGYNKVKKALREGKSVLGAFMMFPSTDIVEMLGYSGFDFVLIDSEHGRMTIETIENLVRAADCTDMTPIVRVPNDPNKLLQVLETGCQGVQIPQVNSSEEVRKIIKTMKYYPEGQRGMALTTRAGNYGTKDLASHIKESNREILLSIQIENKDAINNLSDIVKIPNIDVLFIGPGDLSQSLGLPGQIDHPKVQDIIKKVIKKGNEVGIPVGIDTGSEQSVKEWLDYGVRYITVGPSVLFKSCKDIAQRLKNSNSRKENFL